MKILVNFRLLSLYLCVILSSSAADQLKENSATHFDLMATTEERHTAFPLIMIFQCPNGTTNHQLFVLNASSVIVGSSGNILD